MEISSQIPTSSSSLVFAHGREERFQTFFTLSDGLNFVASIPEMNGRHICACSHGWLVMKSNDSSECFLWNPISTTKIPLPRVDFIINNMNVCLLTSSPTDDSNCRVLFLSSNERICIFCSPGDDRWIRQNLDLVLFNGAVCCKGKIYVLGNHRVGILDVHNQTYARLKYFRVDNPALTWYSRLYSKYAVESDGEVFQVVKICKGINGEIQTFEVFKLNTSRKAWEEVRSLGDRIFLLDGSSSTSTSTSISAPTGIRGNCIYFIEPGDQRLYTFDMERESVRVNLPCPNVVGDWDARWFVPTV